MAGVDETGPFVDPFVRYQTSRCYVPSMGMFQSTGDAHLLVRFE